MLELAFQKLVLRKNNSFLPNLFYEFPTERVLNLDGTSEYQPNKFVEKRLNWMTYVGTGVPKVSVKKK